MSCRCGFVVLICLAAIGCRRAPHMDAYFEMLNAEKRALEDRLYALEYDHEQALKELEAYRAEAGGNGESRAVDDSELPEEPDAMPEIELPPGFEEGTGDAVDDSVLRPDSNRSDGRKTGGGTNGPAIGFATETVADERIQRIFINPRLTKSEDFDLRPGDDGLTVMIEPRNKDGQFVPKPGPVTIVLLDPSKTDEAARYARWDFDESVTRKVLRTDSLDRGLYFRVPWPDTPPDADRLHLFVRYVTEDGRRLEADREIAVRPPEQDTASWSVRPDRMDDRTAARRANTSLRQRADTPTPTTIRAVYEREVESPVASPSAERSEASTASSPAL